MTSDSLTISYEQEEPPASRQSAEHHHQEEVQHDTFTQHPTGKQTETGSVEQVPQTGIHPEQKEDSILENEILKSYSMDEG